MSARCEVHKGSRGLGVVVVLAMAAVFATVALPAIGAALPSPHCAKHAHEAMSAARIQRMLAEGSCAETRHYCDAVSGRELYLCKDPVSGLVGGLIVVGDVVVTGYGARAAYWAGKIGTGRQWGVCRDSG